MSERHIKLCRECLPGMNLSSEVTGDVLLAELQHAHPPELLLAMHEIPKYYETSEGVYCVGCHVYEGDKHIGKCRVDRYEELTK